MLATYVPEEKREHFSLASNQFIPESRDQADTADLMSSGHGDCTDPHASSAFVAAASTPLAGCTVNITTDDEEDNDQSWQDDTWPDKGDKDAEISRYQPMPSEPDYNPEVQEEDDTPCRAVKRTRLRAKQPQPISWANTEDNDDDIDVVLTDLPAISSDDGKIDPTLSRNQKKKFRDRAKKLGIKSGPRRLPVKR